MPLGRPLAGALANAWYPFPDWLRETREYKRVFAIESVVWGAYFLARSGIRLAALLHGSLENFLLISFLTGTPAMLLLVAWSIRFSIRGPPTPIPMRRTGPLLRPARPARAAPRRGRMGRGGAAGPRRGRRERGAAGGDDPARRRALDELIAAARAGDGTITGESCPYPLHELLTHLVVEHGLLLHGSNASLERLEPRPARDFRTELRAVVACDDGIWPIFYAVVARVRVEGVFTACLHVGRRRLYLFAMGADPRPPTPGRAVSSMRCPVRGSGASGDGSGCAARPSSRSCACTSARRTSRSGRR